MRYPIAIEPGDGDAAHGVVVPDLPGCFSAGDSLDEAMTAAEEAVMAWIDAALDAGRPIPPPSPLDVIRRRPDLAGWVFAYVTVDPGRFDDTVERIDLSLPRRILRRLDEQARAAGETRSGFVARLALERENRRSD